MKFWPTRFILVDEDGDPKYLTVIAERFYAPFENTRLLEMDGDTGLPDYSISRLEQVNIEPTNRCNLECRTCIRNIWDEPLEVISEPNS